MKITHISKDAAEMEFEFMTGDIDWESFGGKWISPKLNNGDFDYWLVIEFINWLDATGELFEDNEFLVSIEAVAPSEVSQSKLDSAIQSCGGEGMELNDITKVELLSSYGILSYLWQESGNDADLLLKRAKQAAFVVTGMFGFFMDSPQNQIGSTGWDCIKGDLMAGLERMV